MMPALLLDKGYEACEHLTAFGLINMNMKANPLIEFKLIIPIKHLSCSCFASCGAGHGMLKHNNILYNITFIYYDRSGNG